MHASVSDLVKGERANQIARHLTAHLADPVTGAEMIGFIAGTDIGDATKNVAARDAYEEVSRTIMAASQEINTYLRVQLKNPEKVPEEIKQQVREACIDLAYVSVIREYDERREELRNRHLMWLQKIHDGDIIIASRDNPQGASTVRSRTLIFS